MNKMPYKYDFYLAHPFDSRHRLKEWGESVEKNFGVSILNPFYDAERDDILRVDAGEQERYQSDPAQLVERDLHFIQCCSAVIANITGELSYGTIQEIVYAYLYCRPVYIIVTNGHEEHPWLQYHATKVFTSYREFELWLQDSEYTQYTQRDNIRDGNFPELAG